MKSILILLSFLVSSFCFGQKIITGKVSNEDGEELIGAPILIKGTDKATTTDFDGNYSIIATCDDTLVFSYFGHESQEVIVGDKTIIDIKLSIDPDLIYISFNHPYSTNRLAILYGANYNTFGLNIENYKGLLPLDFSFDLSYHSDFVDNSSYSYSLRKTIKFSQDFYLFTNLEVESTDFNGLQYHSYKLETSKSINLGGKYYRPLYTSLIVGHINYNGNQNEESIGYGIGLSKKIVNNLHIESNLIHWNHFNEFNLKGHYNFWNYYKWSVTVNYKHINQYEEFQIGLGYRLDLYRK